MAIAPTYLDTFDALAGVCVRELRDECAAFLRDTQAMWDEVLPEFLKRGLGITPSEATRAPTPLALMRVPEFDAAFPAENMEPRGAPSGRRDGHQRGRRWPRALRHRRARGETRAGVLRARRDSRRDLSRAPPARRAERLADAPARTRSRAAFREHRHVAAVRVSLARRQLGDGRLRDAVRSPHERIAAAAFAVYAAPGKNDLPRYLRSAGFEELHFLRRYSAKLIYEVELYGCGVLPWSALPDLYVATLSAATGFQYHRADAFVDVDPRFYSARYLRAWQLQALLAETLTERFDADWWRNPVAGPWIVEELFGNAVSANSPRSRRGAWRERRCRSRR